MAADGTRDNIPARHSGNGSGCENSIDTFEPVPPEEIGRRIDGLQRNMREAGIDFCIILQNVDLFYFTGTMQKGVLAVPADGDPMFFVEKSLSRARAETRLPIIPITGDREMADLLRDAGMIRGAGAMELDVVPVTVFDRYRKLLDFDACLSITPLVKALRRIKSAFELEQVRKSGAIMRRVFARAREIITEGATELAIDAELTAEGRRHGHQGFLRMRGLNLEMMTITVVAGYTGSLPSHSDVPVGGLGITPAMPLGSSCKRIEKGSPVCIDYGGGYNGYITDETHVYVIGPLDDVFKKPYETSCEIIEDAAVYGKEGVDAVELFERAAGRAKKAGLGANFMGFGEGQVSFVGHGLGLEINELPVLTARHHTVLQEGMVFAFEPKFVLPGRGAIGVEVDFIVRKDRLERVTDIPLDIVYL